MSDPTPGTPPEASLPGLDGRYELGDQIGVGGMATVYEARDLRHGRRVAVKILRRQLSGDAGDRFRREIAIVAQLTHPHIVPLHDSGLIDGTAFYVMPLIDGETLKHRLQRKGAIDLADAIRIVDELAGALEYAHERGIVHRDVKPANVLFSQGHAMLADFGIARALTEASLDDVTSTLGAGVGTPAYSSPEQASDSDAVDHRSDIYALGCMAYELLTGERPFSARTSAAMLAKHVHGETPTLSTRSGVPKSAAAAVEKALEKNPAHRFDSARAFADAFAGRANTPRRRGWRSWPARRGAALTFVVAAVLGIAIGSYGRLPEPAGFEGRPSSLVVLPFSSATTDEAEASAAAFVAERISSELRGWDSIHAVPQIALSGPMFDLGVEGPTIAVVGTGLRIAESLGVQGLLSVRVQLDGDSARVEAELFDVGSGQLLDRTLTATGLAGSPELIEPIVLGLLGIDAPGIDLSTAKARSSNPEALVLFEEGEEQMSRGRLDEAVRLLEAATDADRTFGLAYHRRASATYWRAADDPGGLRRVGSEITRLSTEATRHSAGLTRADSLHILGFHRFQSGDYEAARAVYRTLLEDRPSDVHAWLTLGSIEYRDPWLQRAGDGLEPRSNLNEAIRAFEEALRLQPTFELGYGHLFDIHRRLTATAYESRGCVAFEEPRGALLAPWEDEVPIDPVSFCPVVRDTVEWMPLADFRAAEPADFRAGADRVFRQSLRMLHRWAAFAPEEPGPLHALRDVLLEQRATLFPSSPERLRALAEDALAATTRALALSSDTSATDPWTVASLELAAGRPRLAAELASRLLQSAPGHDVPRFAANIFVATGRLDLALEVMAPSSVQWYLEAREAGELIPYGGVEIVVERERIAGLPTERLAGAVAALDERWSRADYSPVHRDILRQDAALRMLPAFIGNPTLLREWMRGLEPTDSLVALFARGDLATARVRRVADLALSEPSGILGRSGTAYVVGRAAVIAGDPALARRAFARLDSIPFRTDFFREGWSYHAVGPYWMGRAHEMEGDAPSAARSYERFLATWIDADGLGEPLATDARARLARVRSAP